MTAPGLELPLFFYSVRWRREAGSADRGDDKADATAGLVIKDPRLAKLMDPKSMAFDVKRMVYGGFQGLGRRLAPLRRRRPRARSGGRLPLAAEPFRADLSDWNRPGSATVDAPRGTRCECVGLAVIALPCLLYSMDLTVLNLAVDLDRRETKLASHA